LAPLTPAERDMVLSTLLAFEAALEETREAGGQPLPGVTP
jgi:hypothetical protein